MIHTPRAALQLVLAVLIACIGLPLVADGQSRPLPKAKPVRKVAITLALSAERVSVGEDIVLTESMPLSVKTKVVGFRHEVFCLGVHDEKLNALVLLSREDVSPVPPSDDDGPFTGKDFLVTSTVTAPLDQFWIDNVNGFTTTNKVSKGRSIKFKVRVAGIYQITSTWIERGSEIELVSAPITLTVEPKAK